jgi:hypothetical protein
MKKPKSQNKPAVPQAAEPPTTEQLAMLAATLARSSNERPDMLTYDAMELWLSAQKRKLNHFSYWESYGEMGVNSPTHEDLAMLAVNLARNINDEPKKLVNAAYEIWIEAGFKVESEYFDGALAVYNGEVNSNFTCADYDKDGQIISRDKFFKRVLPQSKRNRSYDLAKVGKAFVRHQFRLQFHREPGEEEFQFFYKNWNAGNLTQANELFWYFQTWYNQKIRETRRAAGMKSAQVKKTRKARPPRGQLKEIIKEIDEN